VDVFGLLIQWMYNGSLLNKKLDPAYQHRLMALWVLAKRLEMPTLQNAAIAMLEERRQMENAIQDKTFAYVYSNTVKGDALRLYLVDTCCRSTSMFPPEAVEERFPKEMVDEIREAGAIKLEDDDGVGETFEMSKYHVTVPTSHVI